eukprot:199192-Chlamydomonas_euryale.AAC.1
MVQAVNTCWDVETHAIRTCAWALLAFCWPHVLSHKFRRQVRLVQVLLEWVPSDTATLPDTAIVPKPINTTTTCKPQADHTLGRRQGAK